MASKWKYANLDASHRIALLKKGNKELFDEEVARTKEITKARRELGLDTSEQEQWMDTVGYSYFSSQVDESTPVSTTGYAKLYLEDRTPSSGSSMSKRLMEKKNSGTYLSDAKYRVDVAATNTKNSVIAKYGKKKEKAREELFGRYPYLEEQLVNEGASLEGGKAKRTYQLLEKELEDIYAQLDTELENELSEIDRIYSGFKNELVAHRRNGTAAESLDVIAQALIKNAEIKYGYSSDKQSEKSGTSKTSEKTEGMKSEEKSETTQKVPLIARNVESSKAPAKDTEDMTVSDKTEAQPVTEEAAGMLSDIESISRQIKKNPEKAVTSITDMLTMGGMVPSEASKVAIEIVTMFVEKASA